MQKPEKGKGKFERTVSRDGGLRAQDMPLFEEYIHTKCQALLEEMDNWLSKLEEPTENDEVVHTGVGIYHFVIDNDDYTVRKIRELLEERSNTE
jgi:hypothetical protein